MERSESPDRAYCTYFDSGYLSRGLALIESLREHGDHSPVWVLALDDEARLAIEEAALPGVSAITIDELERFEPRLPPVKASRSTMEYYFTATPLLMRWVMDRSDPGTLVVYLDADLYFFDDPSLVVDALGDGSVGIIEHKYRGRRQRTLAKYGRFNVGWVGIRADRAGRACVEWWGDRTLEWCSDTPSQGRYADQGYLDQFPKLFSGVVVLASPGFNLAPWNTAGTRVAQGAGGVTVDGDPLVFFHFHGLRRSKEWFVTSQLVYGASMAAPLRELVYAPYVRRLAAWDDAQLAAGVERRTAPRGAGLRGTIGRARKRALDALSKATGNAVRVG